MPTLLLDTHSRRYGIKWSYKWKGKKTGRNEKLYEKEEGKEEKPINKKLNNIKPLKSPRQLQATGILVFGSCLMKGKRKNKKDTKIGEGDKRAAKSEEKKKLCKPSHSSRFIGEGVHPRNSVTIPWR